jgi:hypothetical protein
VLVEPVLVEPAAVDPVGPSPPDVFCGVAMKGFS